MPKPSLLIADHDPRSLRILEVALRKAGYPVSTATDGADALRRVLRTPPDLLLCEVSLPTQDGLAVCAALRNDPLHAHLPIILMSGERTASVQARAIAAGADDFLGKPILLRELIQRVSLLLERRDQQELVKSDAPPAMTGPVGDLGLLDVFQSLENWRKSALVSCEAPGRKATVWVQGGQVIDAEAAPLSGEGAFWRLLTWETGQFRVEFGPVAREAVILGGTQGLLAEAMRRLEELGRLEERLPLATRLQLDVAQLSARLGELPDEVNGVVRCFDGKRSLREAVDLSPLDDLSTLAVVGRLLDEGVLRRLDAPARPPPSKPSLQQWLGGAQPGGVQQRPDAPAELRARVAIETAPAVDQEEEDAAAAAALVQGMAAAEQAELQQRREQEERAAAQLARRAAEAAAAEEQAQREEEGRAARLQAQREASAAAQQASVKPLDLVRFPPLRGVRRERLRRETEEARARALAGEPVRLSRVVELPQWQEGGLDELPAEARSMSPAVGEAAKKFAPDAPVARLTRANGAARAVESEEDVEGPRRSAGPSDPRAGDEGAQGAQASEPGALDAAAVLAALAQAPAAELVVSRSAPQGESVAAGSRAPADGATAREVEPAPQVEPARALGTAPQVEPAAAERLEQEIAAAPAIAPVAAPTPPLAQRSTEAEFAAEIRAALGSKRRPRWPLYAGGAAAALLVLFFFLRPQPATDRKDAPWLGAEPVAAVKQPDPAAPAATAPAAPAVEPKPAPPAAEPPKVAEPTKPPQAAPAAANEPAPALATAGLSPEGGADGYARALGEGEKLLKRGRYKQAVAEFKRAVKLNPESVPALLALGDAYLEADAPRNAVKPLETAARLDASSGRAQLLLGTAWQSLGKNPDAVKAYQRYLEVEPSGEFSRDVRSILANLKR